MKYSEETFYCCSIFIIKNSYLDLDHVPVIYLTYFFKYSSRRVTVINKNSIFYSFIEIQNIFDYKYQKIYKGSCLFKYPKFKAVFRFHWHILTLIRGIRSDDYKVTWGFD